MNSGFRRAAGDVLLLVAVFAAAFLFRFNTLGGAFGGFSNDEFGYLARARQIQAGEVPFRDFNDPGWFLTDYMAAAAQWLGGYNLRSEALLTIGMLSLAAAVTFVLARRVAGSVAAALAGVALQIVLEPRHYNYPKIVLYAAGFALAWAYVDKPNRLRAVTLGALIGLAFLFRHDHLVYLGTLGVLTIACVHRASISDAIGAGGRLAAGAAACIVPFLVFLSVSGGVTEYFRSAMVYVSRDAARTSFAFPRFALDWSEPLVALRRPELPAEARVNVRWAPISDAERRGREERYHLVNGELQSGTTWTYQLKDTSAANIESLVRDPVAGDTQGLDRSRFTVDGESGLRLVSQFDGVENATAYLYYLILALPAVAAIVALRLRRNSTATRVLTGVSYLVPLLVVAAMLNVGFLSRGSTNIRLPDVGVTAALLIAWLIAVLAGRDARVLLPNNTARALVRAGGIAILGFTVLSANGLAQTWSHVEDAELAAGPVRVVQRAAEVWDALGAPPPAFTDDEDQPRLLRVARYVHACTNPGDRLFVLGVYPELYYFADRRFAGGHAWLLPLYYTDDGDEARIVERLKRAQVPIVLTEAASEYDAEYRPLFEQLDGYLSDRYREAGEVDIGEPSPLRVLVRADLPVTRRYEPLNLPCFTASGSSLASAFAGAAEDIPER